MEAKQKKITFQHMYDFILSACKRTNVLKVECDVLSSLQ